MRLIRVGAVTAGLLVAALVGLALPASATTGAPRDSRIRAELGQLVDGYGIPGATVVERGARGTTARGAAGLADIAADRPMEPGDRARIASVTKTFVATVVMQLVAERRLTLDEPIKGLLPEPIPNADHITVRELLSHSSGLFNITEVPGFDETIAYTPSQEIAMAVQHPPNFAPGTDFHYSNTNYIVLGEIVTRATGRPIADEVRARVIRPLHLGDTTFPTGAATQGPDQAHGYSFANPLPPPSGEPEDVTTRVDPRAAGAAGAMVSNGDDLARFDAGLLGGKLVPAGLLAEMERPTPGAAAFFARAGINGVSYGLGLTILQTPCGPAYGHGGDIQGYHSSVAGRAGREVTVLINTDSISIPIWQQIVTFSGQELCV